MAGGKGRQWPVSTPDQQNDYLLDAFASLMGGKAHKNKPYLTEVNNV